MMKTKPIGLYVHIPFCLKKCAYCDFCSFDSFSESELDSYTDALCKELLQYEKGNKTAVDTIFFGGGTPSVLSPIQFGKIADTIASVFDLTPLREFTLEVNPKTLTRDKLSAYISRGVNRISIGLQSIHQNELKKLGRIHTYDDFLNTYEMVVSAGISNISVDLMYGIPDQTLSSFEESLRMLIALNPRHISVYSLILEENTPLANIADTLHFPSEDDVCDMYYISTRLLAESGYRHYEISNYAKDGYLCLHNLKYWNTDEYIGVGISAHSYYCGLRFFNEGDRLQPSSLKAFENVTAKSKCIEDTDPLNEYVMLRLRLDEGIVFSDFKKRFGFDFRIGREDKISMLCKNDIAECDEKSFRLTESGFFVSNAVLAEIL